MRIQKAPRRVGGMGEKCWARREGKRLHAAWMGEMNGGRRYRCDSDNQRLKMGAPVLYQQHPPRQWAEYTPPGVFV
jgi:hypothetical protein